MHAAPSGTQHRQARSTVRQARHRVSTTSDGYAHQYPICHSRFVEFLVAVPGVRSEIHAPGTLLLSGVYICGYASIYISPYCSEGVYLWRGRNWKYA